MFSNRAERQRSAIQIADGDLVVPARIAEHLELRKSPTAKLLYAAAWRATGYEPGRCEKSLPTLAAMIGADPRSLRDTTRGPGPFSRLVDLGAFELICAEPLDFWVNGLDQIGKPRQARGLDPQRALPGIEHGDPCANISGQQCDSRGDVRANISAPLLKFPIAAQNGAIASGLAEGGKGGGAETLLHKTNQTPPPSPSSQTIAGGRSSRAEWDACEQLLLGVGLGAASATIRKAKRCGVSAGDVEALVRYFDANRDRFEGPGALYHRILAARSGQQIEDLWVAPGQAYQRQSRSAAINEAARRQQIDRAAQEAQHAADRSRIKDLESRFGPALRALSREQIELLVRETFGERPIYLEMFRRQGGLENLLIREQLLEQLSQRPQLLVNPGLEARPPPATD